MLSYWILFVIAMIGTIQGSRQTRDILTGYLLTFVLIAITLMIGLRFQVGADWKNYLEIYDRLSFLSLEDAVLSTDPAYGALNWVAARLDAGVMLPNLVCALIFVAGFARLAKQQPNPFLAILIAVPYLIIVVAMGYTRQAAAIGLVCFAIAALADGGLVRIVSFIVVAALFHKSAVLMLPVVLVPFLIRNIFLGGLGAIFFVLLFVVILRSSADTMIDQYVTSNYDSQGALIRVVMNVLAAITFLSLRARLDVSRSQKLYFTANAVLSLISLAALGVASASSGVDRISLYLIPLQIFVYSRLPYITSRDKKATISVLLAVIMYSFSVQFVWLNYADNALAWLPYRNFLFSSGDEDF